MKALFLLFILLLSCSSEEGKLMCSQSSEEETELEMSQESQTPLFEVANVDYHNENIQRIFVVIPSDKVYENQYLEKIICTLKLDFPLNTKSNISFFTEKKYANYKEKVFEGMNSSTGLTSEKEVEYKEWMDAYYLSEYDCGTKVYQTYPGSGNSNKIKKILIKECT